MKTLYQVLGVAENATSEEIRAAYLRLAKKFHPDVNPDCKDWASGMFKECEAAYSILSDEKTRQAYNRNLRMRAMPNQTQAAKNPIVVAIDMVTRAASGYVPEDQMRELLTRMIQENGGPQKPVTLVDLAERVGLLKKRRRAARAS